MKWTQQIVYTELSFEFARSRGPGGQNVNRTNSAAILRWNLKSTQSFTPEIYEKLMIQLAGQMTKEGDLIVRSEEFRDQDENKKRCLQKLNQILEKALFVPKKRRATKPTRSSKEKRLKTKKIDSYIKKLRSSKDW